MNTETEQLLIALRNEILVTLRTEADEYKMLNIREHSKFEKRILALEEKVNEYEKLKNNKQKGKE